MSQVIFTDPRLSVSYTWPVNPISETAVAKARAIERTSNTGNVGSTKQQGDDGDLIFDWQINVLSSDMETRLWSWYMLCKLQTIYVTDWLGEQYEGQIIQLSRQRQPAQIGGQNWAVYDLQFEVWRLISGILHDRRRDPLTWVRSRACSSNAGRPGISSVTPRTRASSASGRGS